VEKMIAAMKQEANIDDDTVRYPWASWLPHIQASLACAHPSVAQRDPSMVARSIDACANNRSIDGPARSIDSADRSIARNIYMPPGSAAPGISFLHRSIFLTRAAN